MDSDDLGICGDVSGRGGGGDGDAEVNALERSGGNGGLSVRMMRGGS